MTKLENRSMKCTFIGYSDENKRYWFLSDGKFIVSRDVIFDESERKTYGELIISLVV